MNESKKKRRRYSVAFKCKLAREYLSGQYSYTEGARLYNLPDKMSIRQFVLWYKKNYLEDVTPPEESPRTDLPNNGSNSECSKSETSAEARIKQLESDLAAAHLRLSSLEVLIEVAEDELSIDIRKKSGTKQ